MYPVLFKIGSIPLHSYGFMIAVGFLLSVVLMKRLARSAHANVDATIDLAFWLLLTGFIGARLLFIITRFSYFLGDPIAIFKLWEGGLVFWGGPLAAVPFGFWYMRKHQLPFWRTADIIIPGLVTSHAMGRIGCLAAGCCFGRPTGTTYGIKFYSELVDQHLHGVLLHPTQIYESVALFLLLAGLLVIQKRKVFEGQVTLSYFMVYPVIRSIIEIFRGDVIRGFIIEDVISTSQFISGLVFVSAAIALTLRLKNLQIPSPVKSRRDKK